MYPMLRRALPIGLIVFLAGSVSAGIISRTTKTSSGTTDWISGTTIDPDEMNNEFNVLFIWANGNIDTANLKAAAGIVSGQILDGTLLNSDINSSANIDVSKLAQTAGLLDADIVGDYSDDAAEQDNTSSPGTADSPTLATNLQIELEQLRYKIEQLSVGTSATSVASGTGTDADATWIDGPLRPGNLIYNGGFDAWQQADCSPCAASEGSWDLVLTPDLADTALTESEGEGDGNGMLITANGAGLEGISQTLDGLKASTNYLAVASVRPTTGDSCRMLTTGADTNQLSVDSASDNAFEVISGIFATDSTPTDVVLELLAVADTDICLFDHVGVYEISSDPAPRPGTVTITDTITDSSTGINNTTVAAVSGLDVTVTPPLPGCTVDVSTQVTVNSADGSIRWACELFENSTLLARKNGVGASADTRSDSVFLRYSNGNPTPGTALAYTVQCADQLDADVSDAVLACNLTTNTLTEGSCYLTARMECPR